MENKAIELAREAGMGGDAVGWLASDHDLQKFYTLCRADYETKLSAVMPADFKDWHENNRNEWPDIAAWVITNLREQRADLEAEVTRLTEAHDWQYKMAGERLRRVEKLEAENAKLRQVISDIAYGLESSRIWGGMDWTYNPLHPFKYLPLRDAARAALGEK